MSNFKLGYPAIQKEATATATHTGATDRPFTNLFSGSRSDRTELATATASNLVITYDLGASLTLSVNFIAICRAKLLSSAYCSGVKLFGNSTNVKPGSPLIDITFSTFMGGNSEDYFQVITETTAYRYWFLEFVNSGTASKYPVSKIFFGKALDLGRDPLLPISLSRTRQNAWSRQAAYSTTLNFDPVTDTLRGQLLDLIKESDVLPVVALDPASYVFNNTQGLHCKIRDHNIEPFYGSDNKVSISIEEEI